MNMKTIITIVPPGKPTAEFGLQNDGSDIDKGGY